MEQEPGLLDLWRSAGRDMQLLTVFAVIRLLLLIPFVVTTMQNIFFHGSMIAVFIAIAVFVVGSIPYHVLDIRMRHRQRDGKQD